MPIYDENGNIIGYTNEDGSPSQVDGSSTDNDSFIQNMKNMLFGKGKPVASTEQELNPFKKPVEQAPAKPQVIIQQAPTSAPAGDDKFTDYLKSQDFIKGIQIDEDTFSDPNKVMGVINEATRNAYGKAIKDVSTVMEKQFAARFEEFTKQMHDTIDERTSNKLSNEKALKEIPLMSDSTMQPVIKSVMEGFRNQGQSDEEVIKNTKAYMTKLASKIAPDKRATETAKTKHLDDLFSDLITK